MIAQWKVWMVLSLTLLFCTLPAKPATKTDGNTNRPEDMEEFQYKAVWLERFSRFIDWPKDSDVNDLSKPFVIGVIEDEVLRKNLSDIFITQQIKGKKVVVRLVSSPTEITGCNLLLLPTTLTWDITTIINIVKKKPIFTISEDDDLTAKGIHIGLIIKREKIRYRMNERALKESNFSWTFHLPEQAEEVVEPIRRRR